MDDRIKWFKAALADKFPNTALDEFSASIGLEHTAFQKYIETGTGLPPFTVNVLHGILGGTVDDFVEKGRILSESGPASSPAPAAGADPQRVNELLAKAKEILEGGGEPAVTLRTVITLLKP